MPIFILSDSLRPWGWAAPGQREAAKGGKNPEKGAVVKVAGGRKARANRKAPTRRRAWIAQRVGRLVVGVGLVVVVVVVAVVVRVAPEWALKHRRDGWGWW